MVGARALRASALSTCAATLGALAMATVVPTGATNATLSAQAETGAALSTARLPAPEATAGPGAQGGVVITVVPSPQSIEITCQGTVVGVVEPKAGALTVGPCKGGWELTTRLGGWSATSHLQPPAHTEAPAAPQEPEPDLALLLGAGVGAASAL